MAGAVPTIFWFDRFDERIGILPVIGELVHTEELFELCHSERGLRRPRLLAANVPEGTLA